MPVDPNNQDPRSTGGGDYTGAAGVGFGGRILRSSASAAEKNALPDDKIERDVDAMTAASGKAEDGKPTEPRLDTDDGKAGRLDELS